MEEKGKSKIKRNQNLEKRNRKFEKSQFSKMGKMKEDKSNSDQNQ
jgi:hypothetical protein